MANDLNRCEFIGRLGRDPEMRYTASGDAIAKISIACGWKGRDKEGTEWVPVVFFGKLAEIVEKYLTKGSQVYVAGRFRTQKYDKDGETRYSTEIVATDMQMLGGKSEPKEQQAPRDSGGGDNPLDDLDDDIPFATSANLDSVLRRPRRWR